LYNIKALIDDGNIYKVSTDNENGFQEWPYFVDQDNIETQMGHDILGDYLEVFIEMYPFQNPGDTDGLDNLYDVYTSTIGDDGMPGLEGINILMIVTDYTSDIYFKSGDDAVILSDDTIYHQLQWRVNAALVNSSRILDESAPKSAQTFDVDVEEGDDLYAIKYKILNGYEITIDGVPTTIGSLESRLNHFFTEVSKLKDLYIRHDGRNPFTVTCTMNTDDKGINHLLVNIKSIVESVENQISSSITGIENMYVSTKPNCYFVKENTYELRSYEDMYGRNKPGSTTASGTYVKRSYGFKFNLDYITEYREEERSNIDTTTIPGLSSAYTIGLDTVGTLRTININGTRVDNSNVWMFHAPYAVQTTDSQGNTVMEEGGVIYTGTSNWGWMKFMKAIQGTFQFIDGPYRLIIMTVPSSSMQQYVLGKDSKYQYIDGTYIVKVGYEDMCYVMVDSFTTTKSEDMFNAINYSLILKRVTPLGSQP
jgi:hypothetical protein